VTIPKGIDYET